MDHHIPLFQTPPVRQMDSTADKSRSRSPMQSSKKAIFSDTPMMQKQLPTSPFRSAQQIDQVRDLTLQCRSLELALDASKKSSEQFLQIIHFKNAEIERLRRGDLNHNEERLKQLIQAMEVEIQHLKQVTERGAQDPELLKQLQYQITQNHQISQRFNEMMIQNEYNMQQIAQLQAMQVNPVQYEHRQFKEHSKVVEQLQAEKTQLIREFNEYKITHNERTLKNDEQLHKSRKEWVQQKQAFTHEYTELKEQFLDSCSKVVSLSSEVERLNQTIYELEQEINYWKNNGAGGDSLTTTMLKKELQILQHENEYLQKQIASEELSKAKIHITGLEMQMKDMQSAIDHHRNRFNELERHHQGKGDKVSQLEETIEQMEQEYQTQMEEFEQQIDELEKLRLEVKQNEIKHKAEKDSLHEKCRQLEQQNRDFEQELTSQVQEYRRVDHQLAERMRELEYLRRVCDQAISKQEYDAVKQTLEAATNETFDLQQEVLQLNGKLKQQQQECDRLSKVAKGYQDEIETYGDLLEKRKYDTEALNAEVETLKREHNRLTQQNQQLQSELRFVQEQCELQDRDIQHLQEQNSKYRKEARESESQMEQRALELSDKIAELDSIKRQYEQQFNQLQQSQVSTKRMSVRQSIIRRSSKLDSNPLGNLSFSEQ